MVKILVALVVALTVAVTTLVALGYDQTNAATSATYDKDPINGANVKMMNVQMYKPMHNAGSLVISTAFIKKDQHYVRFSSDADTFTFYCYYGTVWTDPNTNGGCLGQRGFEHQDYISVLPVYQNGYIASWAVEAGSYIIATAVPDNYGQYYLSASTSLLE